MNTYKKIILLLSICCTSLFVHAQQRVNDNRTNETKIADIAMQLPAKNTETLNRLMQELIVLDRVIPNLASKLLLPGAGDDLQVRAAISGLALYAAQGSNPAHKNKIAQEFRTAIQDAKHDEIKDFLMIQWQYVAGDESVETAAQYLQSARLSDAAARVLVRIGTDAAGNAMQKALTKATGAQQVSIVKALGDMRYQPALGAITALSATPDPALSKVVFHSLAQIADPSSENNLANAAKAVGYQYERGDLFGSYVLFLKNSLPRHADMVAKSSRKMLGATSETNKIAARSAALELLTLAAGEKAIGDIIEALKSSDKQYRQAALNYSENIPSAKMYDALINVAKKEKRTDVKAEIVAAFGKRGDRAAWPFVQECLADNDSNLRVAAITAAGSLAGADAVSPIIKAMNTDNPQVAATGKSTLLHIAGDQVVTQAASALPQAPAPAKIAFIEILAARRALAQAPAIFAQTSSTDAPVRLSAIHALASVVSEKDIPRLAQLLDRTTHADEVAAVQQALFAAVTGQSQARQTDLMVEQAISSNHPEKYGRILAMIGGKQGLEMVMTYGFYSGVASLKEFAVELLAQWSDDTALEHLYKIAAGEPSGPFFDKALTAYISKTGASKNTPEQKVLSLRKALQIARTPAQKEQIVKQITRAGTFTGLIAAGKLLDDPDTNVQQAAVQAVQTIALNHPEFYGTVITDLLNRSMQLNKHPEAAYQKEAVTKHLAELPRDNGFVSMFNGKDLTGWKGLVEDPITRSKMTPKELAQKQAKADEIMRRDWVVKEGVLAYQGKGYENLCSQKMYGDFELYLDWKIDPKADAGIYLRGSPQVQIWDTALPNAQVGSGGLYNNQKNPSHPLKVADNPVNEWNTFYIRMEGDKVTIYLNGQLVTDHTILENYWNRSLPIFTEESIELQAHTTRAEYRDLYVREIPRPRPYEVTDQEKKEGFVPLFNGMNMTGWIGNLNDYYAKEGMIICDPEKGGHGNLYTQKEYSDFIIRFEFLLTPAANNGLGIRTPLEGDAAYVGMELQILDNTADVYKDLHEWQYHGSVYGVIPAKRNYLKPVGEWNYQEVIAHGNRITITLNGTVIVDGDIAEASRNFTATIDGQKHPGLSNKTGHIGFLGHGSWLAFRNLRIMEIVK